jgi:hypothetical protein
MPSDMVSENAKTTDNYLIVMGTFRALSGADHIRGLGLFGEYLEPCGSHSVEHS